MLRWWLIHKAISEAAVPEWGCLRPLPSVPDAPVRGTEFKDNPALKKRQVEKPSKLCRTLRVRAWLLNQSEGKSIWRKLNNSIERAAQQVNQAYGEARWLLMQDLRLAALYVPPLISNVGWHPSVVKGMAVAGALIRPEFCDSELVNYPGCV